MKKIFLVGYLMAAINLHAQEFKISSPDFASNGTIPTQFTCQGANKPPKLSWSGAPTTTKSFVLICDDPDAPSATPWVHWVVYNIPATKTSLDQVSGRSEQFADGTRQGSNSFPKRGYDGPCPPVGHGVHHYHFKLYALDTVLTLKSTVTKDTVVNAMQGHILAQTEVVGTYERK